MSSALIEKNLSKKSTNNTNLSYHPNKFEQIEIKEAETTTYLNQQTNKTIPSGL